MSLRNMKAWRDQIQKQSKEGIKTFWKMRFCCFIRLAIEKKAGQLYKRLQRDHLIDPSGFKREEYTVPFLTFIHNRLKSELEGRRPARCHRILSLACCVKAIISMRFTKTTRPPVVKAWLRKSMTFTKKKWALMSRVEWGCRR